MNKQELEEKIRASKLLEENEKKTIIAQLDTVSGEDLEAMVQIFEDSQKEEESILGRSQKNSNKLQEYVEQKKHSLKKEKSKIIDRIESGQKKKEDEEAERLLK